jgi:hypothetical protein
MVPNMDKSTSTQKPDLHCSARYEIYWKHHVLTENLSRFESLGSAALVLRGDKAGVTTWVLEGLVATGRNAAELRINRSSVFLETGMEPREEGAGIIILLQ